MSGSADARLFECEACDNLGVGDGEITCCAGPMRAVDGSDDAIDEPTLEDLLRTVFDMSDTELDICLCVMEDGPKRVQELADEIDYDRSVVARHLNHLAELGVVEKNRRLLEDGGHVYVYTPTDPAVVRDRFTRLFVWWVERAADQLDALRREKVESIVEADDREPQWRIYQRE
jgi:predicted transcriptional regulator